MKTRSLIESKDNKIRSLEGKNYELQEKKPKWAIC